MEQTNYDQNPQEEEMEKTGAKVSSFDIDCSSKYLYISLLSLMVLLI